MPKRQDITDGTLSGRPTENTTYLPGINRPTEKIESYTEHSATGETAPERDTSKINPQGKPVVGKFPQNPQEEERVQGLDEKLIDRGSLI